MYSLARTTLARTAAAPFARTIALQTPRAAASLHTLPDLPYAYNVSTIS
jgi:hypothetical protein